MKEQVEFCIKAKAYASITAILSLALLVTGLTSRHLERHIIEVIQERISPNFILEAIWITVIIFTLSAICTILTYRKTEEAQPTTPLVFSKWVEETLDEAPKTALLLGSLTTSVFVVVSLLDLSRNSKEAAYFLFLGAICWVVFGAYAWVFEKVVSWNQFRTLRIALFTLIICGLTGLTVICYWLTKQEVPESHATCVDEAGGAAKKQSDEPLPGTKH